MAVLSISCLYQYRNLSIHCRASSGILMISFANLDVSTIMWHMQLTGNNQWAWIGTSSLKEAVEVVIC